MGCNPFSSLIILIASIILYCLHVCIKQFHNKWDANVPSSNRLTILTTCSKKQQILKFANPLFLLGAISEFIRMIRGGMLSLTFWAFFNESNDGMWTQEKTSLCIREEHFSPTMALSAVTFSTHETHNYQFIIHDICNNHIYTYIYKNMHIYIYIHVYIYIYTYIRWQPGKVNPLTAALLGKKMPPIQNIFITL